MKKQKYSSIILKIMELSKSKNHRNQEYLAWLREQQCIISGFNAEAAHHVRLGTNGGQGLRPSDYFCLPLTHEFHTTGNFALHRIGEQSFLEKYKINIIDSFLAQLRQYLNERYNLGPFFYDCSDLITLQFLIDEIELRKDKTSERGKKEKAKEKNEFYEAAKESKRKIDKQFRDKMKKSSKKNPQLKLKNLEFYERAKEAKRVLDKKFRKRLKEQRK